MNISGHWRNSFFLKDFAGGSASRAFRTGWMIGLFSLRGKVGE
jgi:hypothetical protein